MSKEAVQMIFRGEAVDKHSMDVEQLAPALMAVGEICREANYIINADRAKVHVLVKSDSGGKCFDISLEVVQTVYEQVKGLLKEQEVASAKELLEWLGIIAKVGAAPVTWGLFQYLKKRKARNIVSVVEEDGTGTVKVQIDGESSPIIINQRVYQLSESRKILKSSKGIVAPTQAPGFESVEFRSDEQIHEIIDKQEARDIMRTEIDEYDEGLEPQIVNAVLKIYSPVFDVHSTTWRFYYGEEIIKADVSETSIAQDVIRRGSINVADIYKVKLQITQRITPAGMYRNDYKIIDILDFTPGPEQQRLPFNSQISIKENKNKTED
ncbi:MAG: hypothetical protein JSU77_11850 [Fidelibacterota bacterium]|nr:MAG: hypothetical protein JSU77_11850 [Candidatus Neomarinimicrobiota bacterium]